MFKNRSVTFECIKKEEGTQFMGNELCLKKRKREKSLGQLCVQFIDLFVNKCSEISLEQAGIMLSSSLSFECDKMKTKIRRLYDIANVLKALNLIEKILLHNHKPGFRWLGYNGFLVYLEKLRGKTEANDPNVFIQNLSYDKVKSDKIFLVSHNTNSLVCQEQLIIPKIKRFKPEILQIGSPIVYKEMITKKINLELKTKKLKFSDKENANDFDKKIIKREPEILNNLNILLKVVENI